MIDTSRAIRTLVFKTKSNESAFVYVRGDTHRLLVITCAPESATTEQVHMMEQLYEKMSHLHSIDALEDLLTPFTEVSLSALIQHGHKLLLGTVGTGGIYLKRHDAVLEVVSEGFCAEGAGEDGDTFVAVTDSFLDHVGGLEGLTYYLTHYQPEDVVEMMQTYDEGQTFGFGMALYGHEQIVVPPLASPVPDVGGETTVDDDISLIGDGETLTVEERISRTPQSTTASEPSLVKIKQKIGTFTHRCMLVCTRILTKLRHSLPLL